MSQNEVIQVVLSVYDKSGTYSRHAGVVVTSIFTNTKSPVNVTILHDDTLTDDNRRRFIRTAERFGQSVSFVDVGANIYRLAADIDKISRHWSRGTLFRLLIPDLMPIPKVICLDCDIVVNLDIAELWNIDIGEMSLGAVWDIGSVIWGKRPIEKERQRELNYVPDKYFNSGVLLMSLEKLRARHNIIAESFEFFSKYNHLVAFPDQDFLNVCCAGDVFYLEERFNRFCSVSGGDYVDNTILHGRAWESLPYTPMEILYWQFFLASEWSDQMLDILVEFGRGNINTRVIRNPSFPIDRIRPGCAIVLYGAGGLGLSYFGYLKLTKYCDIALWVDRRAKELGPPVSEISEIAKTKYDHVVIAVSNPDVAREIGDDLVSNCGVAPEQLVYVGEASDK